MDTQHWSNQQRHYTNSRIPHTPNDKLPKPYPLENPPENPLENILWKIHWKIHWKIYQKSTGNFTKHPLENTKNPLENYHQNPLENNTCFPTGKNTQKSSGKLPKIRWKISLQTMSLPGAFACWSQSAHIIVYGLCHSACTPMLSPGPCLAPPVACSKPSPTQEKLVIGDQDDLCGLILGGPSDNPRAAWMVPQDPWYSNFEF